MRVFVVGADLVLPTNSGGRSEALNLSLALSAAGHEVAHLFWAHRKDLTPESLERHRAVLGNVAGLARRSFPVGTLAHPLTSYQLSSRCRPREVAALPTPGCDVVVAHHEWTLPTARTLAERARVPLILRSHNDEVVYFSALAAEGSGLRGAYYRAELARIRRSLSRDFYRGVGQVLTISEGDLPFYRRLGVPAKTLAPSLFTRHDDEKVRAKARDGAAFVGALDMPHAVAGLRWFISGVLPKVLAERPDFRLHVGGRRASPALQSELSTAVGVDFHGEIDAVPEFLERRRIFVNPVFHGSGVNMKMGPPIQQSVPIVTTSFGATGMNDFLGGVLVADAADEQAAHICRLASDDALWAQLAARLAEARRGYIQSRVVLPFESSVRELQSIRGPDQ